MSGGGSKSSNTTSNTDNRQVVAEAGIGITATTLTNGSSITITDAGAIQGAMTLAAQVIDGAGQLVQDAGQVYEAQGAQLKDAYTDAKGNKDILIVGGLLVGGFIIAATLRK